jgi:hypothetical protein
MNASPLPKVPANDSVLPVHVDVVITDPEAAHELALRPEGRERDEYACQALRLGVLAFRQASGALDAQTVQREGERMLHAARTLFVERTGHVTEGVGKVLSTYFDPASGSLPQRIERLVKRDGELESMLTKHLDGDRSVLAQTLAQHVGKQSPLFKLLSPEQSDGLVASLARTIESALRAQSEEVLSQFKLDRPDSALNKLLKQLAGENGKLSVAIDAACKAVHTSLTLDDQKSPLFLLRRELRDVLDGLAKSNADFQSEVRASLAAMTARRQEAARSTQHGNTFESAVGEMMQREAQRVGDVYEAVGTVKGQIDRKTGDHVLTLGPESGAPGARVVCEAKARKGYSESDALEEVARARKNRDAQVGLVVMERATAPDGIETLRRIGNDVLVVWDADDVASDVALRLAVSVARALCVREAVASNVAEASLEQIDESIESLANQVRVLDEIIHSGRLIKRRGEKVVTSAERLRETLEREVAVLQDNVKALRCEQADA